MNLLRRFTRVLLKERPGFLNNESPLKTLPSNLPTFYFKIGQLVEFDYKKTETKNIGQIFYIF